MPRCLARIATSALMLVVVGCAGMPNTDPPQVTVVGVEPAQSEGLEARMQLKLRVQNPNNAPIDFNGVYVDLAVLGKSFASGVSNDSGTVPAFGETLISVPVSISVLGIVNQAMGVMGGKAIDKLSYELKGKLNTTSSGTLRFKSQGELALPGL